MKREEFPIPAFGPIYQSRVKGHEGDCVATWTNVPGGLFHRLDGYVTGFFRRVESRWWWPGVLKVGPEFHGAIVGGKIYSTEGYVP
jgi:hypothetical protein